MNFRKANVNDHMVDVVSLDEIENNRKLYSNGQVAVEVSQKDGETYVLPYRTGSLNKDKPGIYLIGEDGEFIVYPTKKSEKKAYQPEIIDFGKASTIQDYIKDHNKVKELEKDILTTPDNIFKPNITEEDSPIMRGLKEAVIRKHIDIDKYADRFGENFPNDKRKFKDNNISFYLFKRTCENLDLSAKIVISDANPNVPNPMGNSITVPLTSDRTDISFDDEDDENEED